MALIQNGGPETWVNAHSKTIAGAILSAIIRSSAILFLYYVICLHHVAIAIFVYLSEINVMLGATLSPEIRSLALIVYTT